MTDADFEEVQTGAPQPETEQQPGTGSAPAEVEPADARDAIQRSRALITVGPSGAQPANFAQQVDFAKTMALARAALPPHLRGNPGDCLAILDIASRANLSPYMVANKTYIQNERLCFESQLFHAFVVQSGLLVGDLEVVYAGEGDERTCTVSAKLRSDGKVRTHTSPPLGKVRPPRNDSGKVKGSPLWDKKPDVQLFYDTSRDFARIYCPTSTLGILSPEEPIETPIGPDAAKDVTGLAQRLVRREGAEGHSDGHAERELANLAPDRPGVVVDAGAPPPEGGGDSSPGKGGGGSGAASPAGATAPAATKAAGKGGGVPTASRKAKAHRVPSNPPSDKAVKAAVDRAEKSSAAAKAKEPAKPAPAPAAPEIPETAAKCKTPEEYVAYARRWIDLSTKMPAAMDRLDEESSVRRRLKVPIKSGAELQGRIERKFEV